MFSLECKSCGAQLTVENGQQVVVCPYCGSQNTISKNIENSGNLFNRANYLRRQNEFDRALEVYEKILEKSPLEYEAYWGVILCMYGIEYVEDPNTHKRIPTCHRTHTESILQQEYYKKACQYAPYEVDRIYKSEAEEIDRLQKEILALARKQEKYDVFICYKETDESGNRTEDSVIAQDLYEHLLRRGYKVFFSRKTLEKKLGSAYEPIIYAALNSARVMIVLGLTPNNFSAVWVRNEWSRYLERMKKDPNLSLIPAYRGFSPYELPTQFSNLQALDMGKIGFIQELCDGIDRILGQSIIAENATSNVQVSDRNLVKRGFALLEEGSFKEAEGCFERCLDQNMENAEAYLGKLLVENHLTSIDGLRKLHRPLSKMSNYTNAYQFASPELLEQLESISAEVEENVRLVQQEKRKQYRKLKVAAGVLVVCGGVFAATILPAKLKMIKANKLMNEGQYQEALTIYQELQGKKGAEEKIDTAQIGVYLNGMNSDERDEYAKKIIAFNVDDKNTITDQVVKIEFQAVEQLIEAGEYTSAYDLLSSLNQNGNISSENIAAELGYIEKLVENKQSQSGAILMAQLDSFKDRPEEYAEKVEAILQMMADANQYKGIKTYLTMATSANITVDVAYWQQESFYCEGKEHLANQKYAEAVRAFTKNIDYKDSKELVVECYLDNAEHSLENGALSAVTGCLYHAQEYDSQKTDDWISKNKEVIYQSVMKNIDTDKKYSAAALLKYIPGYKDADMYEALVSYDNDIKKLKPYIEMDEVKTEIMSEQNIAQKFLEGKWTNGSTYFTMDSEGYISYNLPWFSYGDYYSIEEGILFDYVDGKYETDRKNLFKFTILSWDSVSVYCYKDGSTYVLYRN